MPQTQEFCATGRRKSAVARIRLKAGDGKIVVNGRTVDDYFGRATSRMVLRQSLEAAKVLGQYDVHANVRGGGLSGQADAIKHGIARALLVVDPANRAVLKRGGFLTRDAREKERKKYGQPGARKRFQFSKR